MGGFGIGPAGFGTQGVGVGFFFDHTLADLVGAFAEWQEFRLGVFAGIPVDFWARFSG